MFIHDFVYFFEFLAERTKEGSCWCLFLTIFEIKKWVHKVDSVFV